MSYDYSGLDQPKLVNKHAVFIVPVASCVSIFGFSLESVAYYAYPYWSNMFWRQDGYTEKFIDTLCNQYCSPGFGISWYLFTFLRGNRVILHFKCVFFLYLKRLKPQNFCKMNLCISVWPYIFILLDFRLYNLSIFSRYPTENKIRLFII